MNCCAAIMAGGLSTRFGTDKALFAIGASTMICRVSDRLHRTFDHVFVAGGNETGLRKLGLEYYPDLIPGKGILSGLHTALTNAPTQWVFCCACDMPLINQSVIQVILDQPERSDILLPVIGGVRQPLHAVYRKTILSEVERCLRAEAHQLPDLFASVNVRYLVDTYFDHIPGYELSFVNVNDQPTLNSYRALLERS